MHLKGIENGKLCKFHLKKVNKPSKVSFPASLFEQLAKCDSLLHKKYSNAN